MGSIVKNYVADQVGTTYVLYADPGSGLVWRSRAEPAVAVPFLFEARTALAYFSCVQHH